ncbi:deoxyribonuclease-2-alpha [Culex quinquefasciatus]|uniref:Deoxyribonuclease-2-alpha n=1 Tax=Culex quinquefasciatus TaxID=7176 RepID=B0X9N3_CULQU|nr:deoxyribonuclease-2-alpha [Culex quinquefasciatus]|eukprot:XP_001866355.1 deoxyribonuclease-2-alpha [Culex quinquefasciatus]
MRVALLALLHLSICLHQTGSTELGCRDENGNLVDWYYLYKLPEKVAAGRSETAGLHYTFVTAGQPSAGWQLSARNVNESESIPGRTVGPVLGAKNLLAVLYNDEPPEGKTDGLRGHTKGVVATDGTSGFWLIHSVPKYPPELASERTRWMQLGVNLVLNEPHVYSYHVPDELRERFPKLVEATRMKTDSKPPHWKVLQLRSRAGVTFNSFAKNRYFKKELYADLIAPSLQSNLLVESWQHGTGNLPSDCSKPKWTVLNIEGVTIGQQFRFETLQDHSKWAVSGDSERRFICVGDINRQEHQKVRGGGSVCSELPDVVAAYAGSVGSVESCPKPRFDFSFLRFIQK